VRDEAIEVVSEIYGTSTEHGEESMEYEDPIVSTESTEMQNMNGSLLEYQHYLASRPWEGLSPAEQSKLEELDAIFKN
jgi:hypothetical protein